MILFILSLMAKLSFEAEKMEILKQDNARVTHLIGAVHLYDDKLDIHGAQAWFAPEENSLIVLDSLLIKSQGVDITADSLRFDTKEQVSYLYRRVVVKREETEIRAPRLVINHRSRTATIAKGAEIRDLKEGILVTGNDASYSLEKDEGSILDNPRLVEDKDPSSFNVTGKRMHLSQRSKTASAGGDVKIVSKDATVYCDTLIMFYEMDEGYAYGNTKIVNPEGVINADTAHFKLGERRIEDIYLYPEVTTRYQTEDEDSVVLKSPALTIDMHNEGHEKLIFTGGVNGTYYWKEEAPGE